MDAKSILTDPEYLINLTVPVTLMLTLVLG